VTPGQDETRPTTRNRPDPPADRRHTGQNETRHETDDQGSEDTSQQAPTKADKEPGPGKATKENWTNEAQKTKADEIQGKTGTHATWGPMSLRHIYLSTYLSTYLRIYIYMCVSTYMYMCMYVLYVH
jgi:hypothetical protein